MPLTPIEWMHLKRLCDELGLDYEHVDPQLNYYENRFELYKKTGRSPDRLWKTALKVYMDKIEGEQYAKEYKHFYEEEEIKFMFHELLLILDGLMWLSDQHLDTCQKNMEWLGRHVEEMERKLRMKEYAALLKYA